MKTTFCSVCLCEAGRTQSLRPKQTKTSCICQLRTLGMRRIAGNAQTCLGAGYAFDFPYLGRAQMEVKKLQASQSLLGVVVGTEYRASHI